MSLYYEEYGQKNKESILFLHGGGAGAWMWKKVIPLLKEFHCLVPDLPEHDHSADVKPFTFSKTSELMMDIISEKAHGDSAHIVGLSLGAQLGVQMLSEFPKIIKSAFLSSPMLKPVFGSNLGFYNEDVLRWSHRIFMQPLKNWDWWVQLNMKYSAGIPQEFFPDFKRVFQTMSEDAFARIMTAGMGFRLPAGLERVTTRALVTVGSREYRAMKESAKMLAAVLPNAQACIVSTNRQHNLAESHNWALSTPDLFASCLKAWITGSQLPDELQKNLED